MSKSPKLKLYRLTWADTKAARHLKQTSHIIQVTVCGAFPSRAAFVRGMIESGLAAKGSEAATARFMKSYTDGGRPVDDSDYFRQPEIALLVQNPGKIYISSLNGPSRKIPVPWPPTD